MLAPRVITTPVVKHAKNGRRVASLDGLRGLAAVAIFVFHGWLYTKPTPDSSIRTSIGDYAVHELRLGLVLFFVLSGYLLSRPWFASALDERRSPDLRAYLRSRAARVAPAYYVALVGSIALLWGLSGTPGLRLPPASELPLFFVFAQNTSPSSVMKLNPPMWSLAVEVSFYALLPIIGWLATRLPPRRRQLAALPIALLALGLTWNAAIAGEGLGLTFSKTLAAVLPYFACGMLAALLLHGRTLDRRARMTMIVAGVALVVADAVIKAAAPAIGIQATLLFTIVRDVQSAAGFALIIGAVAAAPQGRVLSNPMLAGMGTISYGFYLWHVPVLVFLRGHGLLPLDPVLGTAVAFVPSVVIALVSWVALERPIIAWGARRNADARERRLERERRPSGRGDVDRRTGGRAREVGTVGA